MKRSPLTRTTRVKPRNASRRVREFARAYGSRERVRWIAELPCLACVRDGPGYSVFGPSQNAHIVTGGVGRKADACLIVPLCGAHHELLHQFGIRSFQAMYRLDLPAEAARVAAAWEARCAA